MPHFAAPDPETPLPDGTAKKPSRIQLRNRALILEAALSVFSKHGFGGATLDQIALEAGLSKPNILYYFDGKEDIHATLLGQLMDTWLDPLVELDPQGDPAEEILGYIQRKLDMSRDMPRESRLFAMEVLQGAPRIGSELRDYLKPLFADKCALIQKWVDQGRLPPLDPPHLIFSIWSTTQHYADFDTQVGVLLDGEDDPYARASAHLADLFRGLLKPASTDA